MFFLHTYTVLSIGRWTLKGQRENTINFIDVSFQIDTASYNECSNINFPALISCSGTITAPWMQKRCLRVNRATNKTDLAGPSWLSLTVNMFLSEPQEMEQKRGMWSPSFVCQPFLEQLSHSESHCCGRQKTEKPLSIVLKIFVLFNKSLIYFKILKDRTLKMYLKGF